MSEGFAVDVAALRNYRSDLSRYEEQTARLSGQVAEADVTNESWGVVGLFVLEQYNETLGKLREHLAQMAGFLGAVGERVHETANSYQRDELETERRLAALVRRLDGRL